MLYPVINYYSWKQALNRPEYPSIGQRPMRKIIYKITALQGRNKLEVGYSLAFRLGFTMAV